MYSRQVEQLARQANAERTARVSAASQRSAGRSPVPPRSASPASASQHRAAGQARSSVSPASTSLRRNTGWAIVSIGLRIAESGNH